MTRRVAPHDLDAEGALLGAMLSSRHAITAALEQHCTPDDFYEPRNRTIATAIVTLHHAGANVDHITVAAQLNGNLERVGGITRIRELFVDSPGFLAAADYAKVVHALSQTRQMLTATLELEHALREGTDPAPCIERLTSIDVAGSALDTWAPVDLRPIVDGEHTIPVPTVCARTDGEMLFYPGVVHALVGESESLKTWLALHAVAQELRHGNNAAYLDFEDTPESITDRLRALGATREQILGQLTYIRPAQALAPAAGAALDRTILAAHPTLVVVDGVTEAMALEGLDLLDNLDVATWLARLPRRIADLGPAVATIDHLPKSTESRRRGAIGAQHKLAGITVSYMIEAIQALARVQAGGNEITGIARILIDKDRPGAVRAFAASRKHVGQLMLTAYPDGGVSARIEPALELPTGGLRPTVVMRRITEALAQAGTPLNVRAIRGAVTGKNDVIELALALLVNEGFIALETGPRGAKFHRLISQYRDDEQEEEGD